MRGITAGLLMLGKTRAVGDRRGHQRLPRASMQAGRLALAAQRLDRLADAIVSVEYYMETLQAGSR
jgi:chemosensory pili system protein ChpA (sensor histidine kinase/response regulator)